MSLINYSTTIIYFQSTLLLFTYYCRCEAFSTYPRTYDLLHLDGLFTAESHRYVPYVHLQFN